MLTFHILSLFPEYFHSPFSTSLIKKGREKGLIEFDFINIRDFASGVHQQVDDRPYGGGPGMVMMAPPVIKAIDSLKTNKGHVVYLTPQGKKLDSQMCKRFAKYQHLTLLCGHYEGVDQRAIELCIDEQVSIGDFVLTSGLPACAVLVDATCRFIPGFIGNPEGVKQDSFENNGLLDYPTFTRPEIVDGLKVPEVLLSGNHQEIANLRKQWATENTRRIRPDLL